MAVTGVWWQTLRAVKAPRRWQNWTYVGIWLAVALLAKSSAAVAGVVVAVTLVICALRERSFRVLVRGAVALALPVLALTGWWFVRNQTLYGDPLGWAMFQDVYRVVMRSAPLAWNDIRQFFNTQIDSFTGVFGWMNVRAVPGFYRVVRICGLLGLVGLVPFFAQYRKELSRDQLGSLAFLAFTLVAQEIYLLWAIQRFNASWYQGRYLFPVIGPIMIFLSLGIAGWLPKRLTALPVTALILVLVGVAIYMPLRVIAPAYPTVTLAKPSLWLVSNKTDLAFGSAFKLRGYEIQPSRDGSTLTLKLYWQAAGKSDFDYSAFVHLIDESGQIVAQKDHAPGESLDYPPTSWNSEDSVADEHVLQIPPNYVLGHTVCGSGCTTGRPASSCRSQHGAIRSGISQFWIGRTRGTEAVFAAQKGGTLEGAALRWRSDRDGDLGTGSQTLATLSPGRHVITLVATDKDGNQATAGITLYAGGKTYLPLVVRGQ